MNNGKAMVEKVGSPYYIAPEVLDKNYTNKCDLWSIGVMTYLLLSGEPPFNGKDDKEVLSKVREGKFNFDSSVWKSISHSAKDFITQLLTMDIEKRPDAQQALKHTWISDNAQIDTDPESIKESLTNLKGYRADQTLKAATYAFIAG